MNWFRKTPNGNWLWPCYGENSRVLKWSCKRIEGTEKAVETPIGHVPAPVVITMVTKIKKICPHCGTETDAYLNPLPTVDIIIELDDRGIILIERKNYPFGWALPGGFVDYGETLEDAAIREAKEETGLDVQLIQQYHTYSNPDRDPRHHSISTVFIANAIGTPSAADDAANIGIFSCDNLPSPLVFDHAQILADYFALREK